jgi:ketosteroid isomerase-like protein
MASLYSSFSALNPFFDIVMEGLRDQIEGAHFFDAVGEDAVFEYRYHFPGYPAIVRGRQALMDLYARYPMTLTSAGGLVVHHDLDTGTVILEYEVHGSSPSGGPYDNRFISVVEIKDRKIACWRDYMDSLAAMTAIRGHTL